MPPLQPAAVKMVSSEMLEQLLPLTQADQGVEETQIRHTKPSAWSCSVLCYAKGCVRYVRLGRL